MNLPAPKANEPSQSGSRPGWLSPSHRGDGGCCVGVLAQDEVRGVGNVLGFNPSSQTLELRTTGFRDEPLLNDMIRKMRESRISSCVSSSTRSFRAGCFM